MDTEVHSDLAHVDEPEHYDWSEHGDWEDTRPAEPHQDSEHEDWPDHINVPSHDDTPHADWSDEHLDTPHDDWSAHGDDPFGAHGDEPPTHDDWWNWFWHNDWEDHFDWSDHSDWPDHGDLAHEDVPARHYDWSNHGDLPHSDEYPHKDQPFGNWSDTPWSDHGDEEPHDDWGDYAEASHLDHLEHLDYPPWEDAPPEEYTLTLRVLEGNGRLCVDGECTRESTSFTLLRGTTVVIDAIPDPGWRIKRFTIDGREYSPPYTLHMYNDHTVEVAFERVEAEAEGELVSWRFDTDVKVDTDYDFEFTVRNVGEAGTLVARIYNISGGTIYVSGEGWSYVVPPGDHVWFSMHAEPGETLTVSGKIRYTTPGTNIIRIAAGHEVAGEYKEDQYVDIPVNAYEIEPIELVRWDTRMIGDRHLETEIEFNMEIKRYVLRWGDRGEVLGEPVTPTRVIKEDHKYSRAGFYHLEIEVTDVYDRTAIYGMDVIVSGMVASTTVSVDPEVATILAAAGVIPLKGTAELFVHLTSEGAAEVLIYDVASGEMIWSTSITNVANWIDEWMATSSSFANALRQAGFSEAEITNACAKIQQELAAIAERAGGVSSAIEAGDNAALASESSGLLSRLASAIRGAAGRIKDWLAGGLTGIGAALRSALGSLGISGFIALVALAVAVVVADYVTTFMQVFVYYRIKLRLSQPADNVRLTVKLDGTVLNPYMSPSGYSDYLLDGKWYAALLGFNNINLGKLDAGEHEIIIPGGAPENKAALWKGKHKLEVIVVAWDKEFTASKEFTV